MNWPLGVLISCHFSFLRRDYDPSSVYGDFWEDGSSSFSLEDCYTMTTYLDACPRFASRWSKSFLRHPADRSLCREAMRTVVLRILPAVVDASPDVELYSVETIVLFLLVGCGMSAGAKVRRGQKKMKKTHRLVHFHNHTHIQLG